VRPDEGNFLEVLLDAAADRIDAPFLCGPEGPPSTYGDIFARAAAIAGVLTDSGITPGDRVLVQIEKSREGVALYLACLHAGAVHVPLNPGFTAEELQFFIDDSDPGLIVLEADRLVDAPAAATAASIDEIGAAATVAEPPSSPAPRTGGDLAALLYTSGTTGRPKGAALTHDNLLHNAAALHLSWRFRGDDRLLHTLPIFHVHGLFVALHCAMLSAIPVTFLPKFDLDAVMGALPEATVFMGVPTHYNRLLSDPRLDHDLVAGMRLFTSGSAPLPDAIFDTFTDRTGHRICERYGMSETGIITSNPYDGERRASTVGFPLPGVQLRVCDDDGKPLPDGSIGVVEVNGPHVFPHYWRRSDADMGARRDGGWFITGDVGSLDSEGRLTLQGRAGDMIISGGENVYPKEIEIVLDTVPGIVESAVIGLPHPDFGEAVTAVLVVDDTYRSAAVDDTLREKLARFKHPKARLLVAELPRNTMGKVQKSTLRTRYHSHYATAT
jgi:malonyl-CoA/methylmalonyl-CoA synthetase